MTHRYSVKLTQHSNGARPSFKGFLYERDVQVARVQRNAVHNGFCPPTEFKFFSTAALERFEDFSDSLTMGETIEALLPF